MKKKKNAELAELKVINNTKHLEKYLRPQWTWKTHALIVVTIAILALITIDLKINFIKLFSNSSKYFADILGRMIPPDFSNFKELVYSMIETIEIAILGTFIAIVLSVPLALLSAKNIAPNIIIFFIIFCIWVFILIYTFLYCFVYIILFFVIVLNIAIYSDEF